MNKTAADKKTSVESIELNTPKCAKYGDAKNNHPACAKCLKKFAERQKACLELTAKTAKTAEVKKITGSHLDCFNASINSDTHLFIKEIYKNPCTMKSIKACVWNTRPNTFYCKAKTLIKNGYMTKNSKSGSFSLTAKGKKIFTKWIAAQKLVSKK